MSEHDEDSPVVIADISGWKNHPKPILTPAPIPTPAPVGAMDVPKPREAIPKQDRLHAKQEGDAMKTYVINYITRGGEFHAEKVAAKGMVSAITAFYMQKGETGIVAVFAIL